jgi:hypothetical protein
MSFTVGQATHCFAVLCILILQTSCHSNRNVSLPLLAPHTWPSNIQVTQAAAITYKKKEWRSTFVLALSPNAITIVGLLPLGQRLFTVQYKDGQEPTVSTQLDLNNIPLEQVLSLIQLALWPESELESAYRNEWRFESAGNTRTAFLKGRKVVEIERSKLRKVCGNACSTTSAKTWPYSIYIKSYLNDMTMNIKTVEYEVL